MTVFNRLPWPGGEGRHDIRRHRATVSYWMVRYDSLRRAPDGDRCSRRSTDPSLLLVAANAAFRNSAPQVGDRKAAVERLDAVIQRYADVLRKDPNSADAAYNYEFVSKMRDTLAKAPRERIAQRQEGGEARTGQRRSASRTDGPRTAGCAARGHADERLQDLTPMRYDEREEQMDPGRGKEIKRKG